MIVLILLFFNFTIIINKSGKGMNYSKINFIASTLYFILRQIKNLAMKSQYYFLLIALIIGLNVTAQKNLTIKWGPELKTPSKTWISRVLGHDDKNFYTLRTPVKGIDKSFWLEKYSNDKQTLLFSKEIELPKVGRATVNYVDLFMFNDNFLLITSHFDKKLDIKYAFAQVLSKDGVLSSKFKEIDQVEGKKQKTTTFDIATSRNGTKLLVYKKEEVAKDENEKFAYTAYDESLEQLWTKSIELDHSAGYVEIGNYKIDDEGNVYAMTKQYPDKYRGEKKAGRKMQNYKYAVILYNPDADGTKQFQIDLGMNKFVSDIGYSLTADNKLAVVGLYSKENSSSMAGTFFISLDANNLSMSGKNMKEFDREFLLNFMSERKVDKDEELSFFTFKEVLLREDGGFFIVAEQDYMYVTTSTDSQGNTSYTYHYVCNELIVLNIDSDGNILWTEVILKKQHTTNDLGKYLSYAMAWTDQQMHFIFNDNPKNVEQFEKDPEKLKVMNNPKKSIATMVTMSADGKQNRAALFQSKDFGTILKPKLNYAMGNSEIIIYGEKGSKYKFGKMTFANFD